MHASAYLPHDLLWVAPGAIELDGTWPEWADAAWLRSAPVVVRREATGDGRVPVGLRGLARSERAKAYAPAGAVIRRMAPEDLAAKATAIAVAGCSGAVGAVAVPRVAWGGLAFVPSGTAIADGCAMAAGAGVGGAAAIPALAALMAVAPVLNAAGLAWGPTGGVGFFLACGLPVLRPGSDLDLLVRAPGPLKQAQAAVLDRIQSGAACRIDIQVDTGHGAFAFAEWRRGGRVMLKTDTGPQLVADPWTVLEAA